MGRSILKLMICSLCFLLVSACSSKYMYVSKSDDAVSPSPSEKILGLPIMFHPMQQSDECITKSENDIDKKLTGVWKGDYVPISASKTLYREQIEILLSIFTPNQDTSMRINSETLLKKGRQVCALLKEKTGCRYAVLPHCIKREFLSQTVIDVGYFIPAGPIIIYGSLPLPLSDKKDELPLYMLSLIDLEMNKVVTEVVYAKKIDIDADCLEFPTKIFKELDIEL